MSRESYAPWAAMLAALCLEGNPQDAGFALPAPVTYTYKAVGDCKIQADVYPQSAEGMHPAILWIHGGALLFGDRRTLPADQAHRYLQAGYVIVSIDYRLAPESKLPDIVEDVQDAYRWLREKGPQLFHADPDRVAVVGNSAGGYLTLLAGVCLTPRPRALVSFYGYGDITGEWTTRPSPHYQELDPIAREEAEAVVGHAVLSGSPLFPRVVYYNYCRQNGLWVRAVVGRDPETEAESLDPYCPARHVTADYPATLLLHGDQDRDVPFAESEHMAAALEQQGVPHRLVRMKGMDHLFDVFPGGWGPDAVPVGLGDPRVAEAFDSVVAFLDRYTGE